MKIYQGENIRNVILLSHSGAGKTSLAEALLYNSGVISRLGRVEEGTTTSDYDPEEIKRRISVALSLLPVEWNGYKINLLDTPGYADFVGEVRSALRVADGAVVMVCAASGVEVGTEQAWKNADEYSLPRLIFINKIDRENADFFKVLGQIQNTFGQKCIPLQLPIGAQDSFQGIIDLVGMKALLGEKGKEGDIPPSLQSQVESFREKLVEAVAETDDELLARYLEGEELPGEQIRQALHRAVVEGKVFPVLVGSALANKAVSPLLNALIEQLPAPAERGAQRATNPNTQKEESLPPRQDSLLATLAFKTTADPYVGKLSYLRVFSGTLHSDSHVWNANKGKEERIGQLFVLRGKTQEVIPHLVAGDLGAVAKLSETGTGDTLCGKDRPFILSVAVYPEPVYTLAVHPKTKADLDKLGAALSRVVEEDPTLQTRRESDTGETILSGMGESHIEVAVERMRRKFGVDVRVEVPKVPYKETITIPVKSEYKHKKQTGGHGQYGHVFLELQPLPRGSGFEFTESIFGGVIPRNYIPAVEKGVLEALPEGILAGYPVVDVKVNLYDGSYHTVDSSDMAFKIAGSHAFRKGLSQGQPVLLEPIVSVDVLVPEQFMGDVIGDLNRKRAKVLGMAPQNGVSLIEALAPLAEMLRYATDLRSLTQGRGSFKMVFHHYEEVPPHITPTIIAAAKKEQEER